MSVSVKNYLFKLISKIKKSNGAEEKDNKETFEDLTPKGNIDENSQYTKVISWALKKRDIKNIALTGPYGSGKSSILKTFQIKNAKEYKFLNISLASFKEEGEENENILEKGILQQMFYKVSSNTLPFSRFKRIKNEKRINLYIKVLSLVAFIIIGIHLFNPNFLMDKLNNTVVGESITSGNNFSVIVSILLLGIFSLYFIYLITIIYIFFGMNFKLNKLTIPNATIEISRDPESSVFDKYLDEIIYFFETTDYQVVIFEDLDRFNNIEIFEKLRSLNTLINNSDQINRRIVFLYAIKDDMFESEDDMFSSRNRTKFFDFIIPVIPVISSSNSYQILKDKLRITPNAETISEDLINDITFYIDDMRILINICNEYILYKEILGSIDLIENNLLAMIVYKNIYPKDFSDLQFNKGVVFDVIKNKADYVNQRVDNLESEIQKLRNKINGVETEVLESIEELNVVYARALFSNNKIIQLDGGHQYNENNWEGGRFFQNLKEARSITYYNPGNSWRNVTREQIASVFDTKVDYYERKSLIKIKEKNQLDMLKQDIEILEKEKQEVMAWSLKHIINHSDKEEIFKGEIREKKLLMYLIRNGYIDEMYPQYMNYFYPGSITTEDMKFIMSVKDLEALPFNYSLSNVNKIVDKLHGADYKRPEILNYDLMEFLLTNKFRYSLFLDAVMEQLVNQSQVSLSFIDNFKQITKFKEEFLQMLGNRWPNMWSFIQLESNYSSHKVEEYLRDIIKHMDIKNILAMDIEEVLSQYISNKSDFFSLLSDIDKVKVENVIVQLNVKFSRLDLPLPDNSIIDIIHENNLYVINQDMIKLIINHFIGGELVMNYSKLTETDLYPLVDYIEENINEYIEHVFLTLEKNQEDQMIIIELLNREDITTLLKVNIIQNFEGKLELITSVNKSFWQQLLNENKVISNWANLLSYYAEYKSIDKTVLGFLNIENNSSELSRNHLEDISGFDQDLLEEFSTELTLSMDIREACFEKIVCSLICWSSFPIEELPNSRVKILIDNNILLLSKDNYKSLKVYYDPLHLTLAEKNIKTFISEIESFDIDSKDIIRIFESGQITDSDKMDVINNLNEDLISQDIALTETLYEFLMVHNGSVKDSLIKVIMESEINTSNKIYFLISQLKNLDNGQITKHLQTLNLPYSDITENGKRPFLENTSANRDLLRELKFYDYISSWSEQKEKLRVNTKYK